MKKIFFNYQDSVITNTIDTTSVAPVISLIKNDSIDSNRIITRDTTKQISNETPDSIKTAKTISPPSIEKLTQKKVEVKVENQVVQEKPIEAKEICEQNFLKNLTEKASVTKPENIFLEKTSNPHQKSFDNLGFKRVETAFDWVLPFIFMSMVIMIWVKKTYLRYVELLFSSINNYQMSLKLYKDPSSRYTYLSYILNFNAAIIVGLFLYQLTNFYNIDFVRDKQLMNYFLIVLFLIILYILQFIGYSILGKVIESESEFYEFLHHTYAINKVLGISMIPIVIIISYAPEVLIPGFLILGAIIIFFFYVKRVQRGIRILMQKQFLKFQHFLYFCTLEILPLMVISKYVSSLIERSF